MDGLETILTRRSIRKYTDKSINKDDYIQLIKAAVSAPSAGNQQPWQFVLIQDKNILEKVLEFHQKCKNAFRDSRGYFDLWRSFERKYKDYWVQDCAAASQNLLLAAHSEGLGACWLGIYPKEDRGSRNEKINCNS